MPEVKPSDLPDPKVEKAASESSQNKTKKFSSSPLKPSGFRSFSSFGVKMSGDKPSTSLGASPLRASFLRPPQLASPDKFGASPDMSENSTKYSFALKPARLSNPFAKASQNEETSDESGITSANDAKLSPPAQPAPSQPAPSLPKFVPLGSPLPPSQPRVNPAPPSTVASTSTSSGFVFGQNLHERVSDAANADGAHEKNDDSETVNNGASSSSSLVGSNGTTENLFTSVLKREQVEKSNDSGGESGSDRPSKSLSEAAKEYEESRAVKRKYDEVTVITGEEDEINILQINCKLFAFDKVKSAWVERGRGNLRLNDKETGTGQKQSRIIMRTTGSFRVVLNTKLWPGMIVEKVSTKSVRLTAIDAISGEVLVFLVMASPKDADYLFNYLESRVASLKASCAESATAYPDASRKNNLSETNSKDKEDKQAKKRAVDASSSETETNHVSKLDAESQDSQDTGGSEDLCLGKDSEGDVSNSTSLS